MALVNTKHTSLPVACFCTVVYCEALYYTAQPPWPATGLGLTASVNMPCRLQGEAHSTAVTVRTVLHCTALYNNNNNKKKNTVTSNTKVYYSSTTPVQYLLHFLTKLPNQRNIHP